MSVAAISAIPRVAAPYPARVPMLDDTRPTWETERAAQSYAARQAQRSAQAQAAWEAQRIARAQAASAGHETSPSHKRDASPRTPLALATSADIDELRNLYAESRMRRAVEDFTAQPDPLAQRAGSANDLGTIEGLAPLQPYRVAMGNPQVQELQAAVAMKAAGIGIPKVANIGATENVTDNARYRPGAAF
ncbi:hypothetical protein D3C86_1459770 [compost metagenome]